MMHDFESKAYGFYTKALGLAKNLQIRKALPELAKHTSKEKMEVYRNGLYNESFRLTSVDTHIIAPMFGFRDSMEYYKAARITGRLHEIKRCPTMFLQSWDDILMTPESFPKEEIKANPNLLLACTKRGGHCCHLTHSTRQLTGLPFIDWVSWFFPSSSWFAEPAMDFIDTIE